MLHEVVLPNAKRDDSALFKERLAGDKAMQAALTSYEDRLRAWYNVHTQSMFLRGEGRKLQYQQWQDLLKKGWGTCAPGTAERLHSDVALSLCAPFKAKIVAPAAFERKFGVWIGGSILSSLGSFQQMWLSKKEYDDDGPTRLVEGRWD